MALEKDSIKDLFSSKLGGSFEPEVPASIWGGIDQLLPKEPSVADPSSTSTSSSSTSSVVAKASVIKAIAVATGIAALVTTTVLIIPSEKIEESEKISEVEKIELVKDSLELVDPDVDLAANDHIILSEPNIYEALAEQRIDKPSNSHFVAPSLEEDKPVHNSSYESPKIELDPKTIENEEELMVLSEVVKALPSSPIHHGISIGFNGNIGVLADNYSQSGGILLFSEKQSNLQNQILNSNNQFELHHNQPISFALTLDKRISSRFSIETGIQYTYLSSNISSSKEMIIHEEQKFHYLGIPLYLNYDIYRMDKMRLYLSLGVLVQKDIKGKYKSSMIYTPSNFEPLGDSDDYLKPNIGEGNLGGYIYNLDENIHQDNLQFSGHLLVGISYPLYKKVYLYGTVGGGYYFDAKNKYRTIYSDKKTQIDINLGLKFNF